MTQSLMDHFKVDIVVHGSTPIALDVDGSDPHSYPKKVGRFKKIDSGNELTTGKLVERILARRLEYEERNKKKEAKERAAYEAFMKTEELAKNGNATAN